MSSTRSVDERDIAFMREALAKAYEARKVGEVPVGALVVRTGEVVGHGFNCPINSVDPTHHAEIEAIRAAAGKVENYRLVDCTLYVTVEPCLMCISAMVHARIGHLVFGARQPKTGAIISTMEALSFPSFNHRFSYREGVLAEECRALMQEFFRAKRAHSQEFLA